MPFGNITQPESVVPSSCVLASSALECDPTPLDDTALPSSDHSHLFVVSDQTHLPDEPPEVVETEEEEEEPEDPDVDPKEPEDA